MSPAPNSPDAHCTFCTDMSPLFLQISGCIILGVSIYLKVNKDGNVVRLKCYHRDKVFTILKKIPVILFHVFHTARLIIDVLSCCLSLSRSPMNLFLAST
uniref:Uncharacterized protein n=1 Tax=Mola mola TaxID=94237 RepID=A0A3Q3VXE4_MOLML